MASTKSFAPEKFDGGNAKHRDILAHMTTFDIGKLLAAGADMAHVNFAAVQVADDDLEAALRIYDAFLDVSFDDVPPAAPVDATCWLLTARDRNHPSFTKDRARRYLAKWAPYAKRNTLMYLNLASLQIALGQLPKAIATLREGLLEGDPNLAAQIADDEGDPDFVLLGKQPGFKALAKITPVFPRALRGLELASACELDEDVASAMMNCDLEEVRAHPVDDYFLLDDPRVGNMKAAREVFQIFGSLPDGGEVAFWKRKQSAKLEECPVVIFGSDGAIAVYARDFDGFLCLLSHGLGMHDVEHEGFRVDVAWKAPSKAGLARGLKPVKALTTAIANWSSEAKKRKPLVEREAAIALVPKLIEAIASLAPKKTTAKPAKKGAAKKAAAKPTKKTAKKAAAKPTKKTAAKR